MNCLIRTYVKAREFQRKLTRGQTMTEYAMIVAVVALAVVVSYHRMGQDINHLAAGQVDNELLSAS